jgi:prepilin-type N-terminal cleavage/methylation domain-containing protein
MKFIFREEYGFTFIEIIAVILLIGIISVIVVSRNQNLGAEALGQREVIKNHIRYAQLMAMKSNTACGVQFAGSSYAVFRNNSTADKIILPNKENTDLSISADLGSANETIYFDLWGIPYSDAVLATPRPSGLIGSLGITITADTGSVQ